MLVGGILFEIVTGLMNIQYDYAFGFSFYTAHYIGAWVFLAGFVAHAVLKLPVARRALRTRSLRAELRVPTSAPEPVDDGLVATDPAPPTMSRRGALALVGGGALFVATITAGQTIGGPLRDLAVLLPRGRARTSRSTGRRPPRPSTPRATGAAWRLALGARTLQPRRSPAAPPAHRTAADRVRGGLVDRAGLDRRAAARPRRVGRGAVADARRSSSRSTRGPFGRATLSAGQVLDPDALLALQVNGADLSPDHGYPARVIVPALPGVHCTKWVRSITFRAA